MCTTCPLLAKITKFSQKYTRVASSISYFTQYIKFFPLAIVASTFTPSFFILPFVTDPELQFFFFVASASFSFCSLSSSRWLPLLSRPFAREHVARHCSPIESTARVSVPLSSDAIDSESSAWREPVKPSDNQPGGRHRVKS